MNQSVLLRPFADVVNQSQHVFRKLLKTMSEPGTLIEVPGTMVDEAQGHSSITLFPSVWSIVQSLLDSETTVYLSPLLANAETVKSIQFYTNAAIVKEPKVSAFSMIALEELTSLAAFNCGTLVSPHMSTTLFVQVDDINEESTPDASEWLLTLSGPGIRHSKTLAISGLQLSHCELLKDNHQLYPCGVDIVFCAPTKMSAVVRSTAVSWENV